MTESGGCDRGLAWCELGIATRHVVELEEQMMSFGEIERQQKLDLVVELRRLVVVAYRARVRRDEHVLARVCHTRLQFEYALVLSTIFTSLFLFY